MAYARMVEGSDVYLWPGPNGIHCSRCQLREAEKMMVETPKSDENEEIEVTHYGDTILSSREEALEHLKNHREAGHNVPQKAIDRLETEISGETWYDG